MDSLLEPEDQLFRQYLTSPWGEYGRSATLGIVSLASKVVLNVFNSTKVIDDSDTFLGIVYHRTKHQGLITVSNHTSTIDDPFIFSAITPWSFFYTEHNHRRNRWSLCAKEICYKNRLLGNFFQSGKTLPIERGKGIEQPILRIAAHEVSGGAWLHIFPEGKVVRTGTLGPLRWGVGRLICDAALNAEGTAPIVLPFYHSGMGEVMPAGAVVPRIGKQVTVVVGRPIPLDDLTCRCTEKDVVWKEITARIEESLVELEKQAPPNKQQNQEVESRKAQKAHKKASLVEGALPLDENNEHR